jgi:hypothetical protein
MSVSIADTDYCVAWGIGQENKIEAGYGFEKSPEIWLRQTIITHGHDLFGLI